MNCPTCGEIYEVGARFCGGCGNALPQPAPEIPPAAPQAGVEATAPFQPAQPVAPAVTTPAKACVKCGRRIPVNESRCGFCGAFQAPLPPPPPTPAPPEPRVLPNLKLCQACGREMPATEQFCPNCGTQQVPVGQPAPHWRPLFGSLAVLALFVGMVAAQGQSGFYITNQDSFSWGFLGSSWPSIGQFVILVGLAAMPVLLLRITKLARTWLALAGLLLLAGMLAIEAWGVWDMTGTWEAFRARATEFPSIWIVSGALALALVFWAVHWATGEVGE